MIKKWLTFSIQSHLFLAISTFVFSMGVLGQNQHALVFSFALSLAVLGVYNLNRLNKLKKEELPSEFLFWYKENQFLLSFLATFCLLISALLYVNLLREDIATFLLLVAIGIITILYIFSIKQLNIRQIPGTKSLWVSLVWTCIAVVIPKMTLGSFERNDLLYFILFFALTIPGDLRDSAFDSPRMKTIPQLIGNRTAELVFYGFIAVFLLLNYFMNPLSLIGIILVFIYILSLNRSSFRYELMDGLLLVLGFIYLFGKDIIP